ncbi:MAG TPA: 6-carboxyhexanoate--CoA ligase [Nitrospirota bacterium]|nr:6-carboxyhexanoate--CoA ligase [Nitrospirota bacterium]
MNDELYSIRMRASRGGTHISGAERIIPARDIGRVAVELVGRAKNHGRGRPDSITVTVDCLSGREFRKLATLPITSLNAEDHAGGRELAVFELIRAGVSEKAARTALESILRGASPDGGNMRGAMVVDAATGERLETDRSRGVRARAVDYAGDAVPEILAALEVAGLGSVHVREALALATKVAGAPGAVAELCISDDPGYLTGYAASQKNGYVRITPLKEDGGLYGGRAFFVDADRFDMDEYLRYMRETPVLVTGPIRVNHV